MFNTFPKIPRLYRDVVITEKLDGTNAQIIITEEGDVHAASRNRLISVGDDNFGFAKWVSDNHEELKKLGPGHHFGEWWGVGIQRGYGLSERRFSLFNTYRWNNPENRPSCCHVVPTLYQGSFAFSAIEDAMQELRYEGSKAVKGFNKPEGIIVYHSASNQMFKILLESDHLPKSLVA